MFHLNRISSVEILRKCHLFFVVTSVLLGCFQVALASKLSDLDHYGVQSATVENGILNIASPQNGVSRNRLDKLDVGAEGIIINNSLERTLTADRHPVPGNGKLGQEAEVILLEVNDASSAILGKAEVVGQKARVIIATPKRVTVDGGSFINANGVELVTQKVASVDDKGGIVWEEQKSNEEMVVGSKGINVADSTLTAKAGKIRVDGDVIAKTLSLEANGDLPRDSKDYILDITGGKMSAYKISLLTTGDHGNIRLSSKVTRPSSAENYGSLEVEARKGNIVLTKTFVMETSDWDLKFAGINLHNEGILLGRDARFIAANNLVNENKMETTNNLRSVTKGFYNYGDIDAGKLFHLEGDYCVNDVKVVDGRLMKERGGRIAAEWMDILLSGKSNLFHYGKAMDDVGFYQNFDATLEARDGMVLVSKGGDVYFGYKKELLTNGEVVNYSGSRLLSYGKGGILIQASGRVVFDGTEVKGGITVEAGGAIQEDNPIVIENRKIKSGTERWCPSGIRAWGTCFGGWHSADVHVTQSFVNFLFIDGLFFNGERRLSSVRGNILQSSTFAGTKDFRPNSASISYRQSSHDYKDEEPARQPNRDYLKELKEEL